MKAIILAILITAISAYAINVWKFVGCDFESPWKCELLHGAGVIAAPLSLITVWFPSDREDQHD